MNAAMPNFLALVMVLESSTNRSKEPGAKTRRVARTKVALRGGGANRTPAGGEGMKKRFSTAWSLLKQTVSDWSSDEATRLAAAMAFYTLLSLAPLLMV